MYEINYTMFFVCSILLGKIKKAENGVMNLIPKSLRDVTISVIEEITEAGREHFSDSLINLVDSLVSDDKGVFYILDNYQEMKDIHGDIVDEVIIQASQFCCQYYRSNQTVLDELIGSESVTVVKACSVSDDSGIQDHINFIRAFSMAGMYIVVAGDAENIVKTGALLMQNKSQENQKQEDTSQSQASAANPAADEITQAAEEARANPTLMWGTVNLLDPAGILSQARENQKIVIARKEAEDKVRKEAAERRKKNSGPFWKLGLSEKTKEAKLAEEEEVKAELEKLHAVWREEDKARAASRAATA